MELSVVKPGKKKPGKVEVSEATFARDYNEALIHQVVTAYLAGALSLIHISEPTRPY